MATTQRADTLAALAKDLVATDKAMQKQLRELVNESMVLALYTMRHGSQADKLQLMKHLTPHMLEALRTTNQSSEDEERRQAYEEIRRMCRGEDV